MLVYLSTVSVVLTSTTHSQALHTRKIFIAFVCSYAKSTFLLSLLALYVYTLRVPLTKSLHCINMRCFFASFRDFPPCALPAGFMFPAFSINFVFFYLISGSPHIYSVNGFSINSLVFPVLNFQSWFLLFRDFLSPLADSSPYGSCLPPLSSVALSFVFSTITALTIILVYSTLWRICWMRFLCTFPYFFWPSSLL